MSHLRLLIVLLLAVALDFAAPAVSEAFEPFDEAAHAARTRRPIALPRDARAPAPARDTERARVQRRFRVDAEASRRSVTIVPARKAPPAIPEPSSASEDH